LTQAVPCLQSFLVHPDLQELPVGLEHQVLLSGPEFQVVQRAHQDQWDPVKEEDTSVTNS